MGPRDIEQLPKEFITTYAAYSVELAWDTLSESFKRDPEIAACLRCREHSAMSNGLLAPMKRECNKCMKL